MSQNSRFNRGFTLAELLVVVTIIVIIALGLLMTINPFIQFLKGYDTVRRSDLNKLKTAFENYYSEHDCYPDQTILSQCGSSALSPYLDIVPCDPTSKEPYKVKILPANTSCPQKFSIYANISNTADVKANEIKYCKNTIAASSPDMNYVDIVNGCSGIQLCKIMYGCVRGTCSIIAQDSIPTCSPNSCDPTCGTDCSKKNRKGAYTNECKAF
jgi:prepilin-type N-terminal cleavage/methylation domain-containing protein